jgi:membrane protease YdiL (CAAX protease family)
MQALAFGLLHLWGFPGGWTGVALASIYGAIMGAARFYAQGMFVPWAAHVLTDLTIFTILFLALQN